MESVSLSDLLGLAAARAEKMDLTYAGALTPKEAAAVLKLAPSARLVDIRTRAELDWVGRIPGSVEIEWNSYPGSIPNPHFLTQLKREIDPEALLLFICRSGARSHNAAMAAAAAGLGNSYNVLEGFEGDKDAGGQRGKVGGWRHAGLPWSQS
ncbi:MAG: rhodanese [Candidatus Dactylopiibacterium carminicum]|nr:MAG: rhodanese [Candidatus Dactylopiibacterium carminicum]